MRAVARSVNLAVGGVSLSPRIEDADVTAWYRDHFTRIKRMALRWLGDEAAADDVAQESLVRAWCQRPDGGGRSDVGPWLTTVARNLCMDAIRRRRKLVPFASATDLPDSGVDIEGGVEAADDARDVRLAWSKINERHRRALYMRDVEGVGYPILASRFGIAETAMRMVVARARRALRRQLEEARRGVASMIVLARVRFGGLTRTIENPAWASIVPAVLQAVAVAAGVGTIAVPAAAVAAPPDSQVHSTASHLPAAAPRVVASRVAVVAPSARTGTRADGAHGADATTRIEAGVSDPVTGADEFVWLELSDVQTPSPVAAIDRAVGRAGHPAR